LLHGDVLRKAEQAIARDRDGMHDRVTRAQVDASGSAAGCVVVTMLEAVMQTDTEGIPSVCDC
jgi:hypothetical protein